MNHALVIDSSVAVKLLLEEEFSDQAQALHEASLQAGRILFAPPHFSGEVCNALYQRLRTSVASRNITEREAEHALSTFLRLPIRAVSSSELYQRAFVFAKNNHLPSMYDSLYVVAAQMVDAELWTADRRLFNALGPAAPWVRWIGDYNLL